MYSSRLFFLLMIVLTSLFACEIFEDKCEGSDKPRKQFDIHISGKTYDRSSQGMNKVNDIWVKIDLYKEHCSGGLSDTYTYGYTTNNEGIFESCNLGFSVGMHMDNAEDELHLVFRYKKLSDENFHEHSHLVLPYSTLEECPVSPPTAKLQLEFTLHLENADQLTHHADLFSVLVKSCQ